jgi:hypothetical protein
MVQTGQAGRAVILKKAAEKGDEMNEMRAVGLDIGTTCEGGKMTTVTIDGTAIQEMVHIGLGFSAEKATLPGAEEARHAIAGGNCIACEYLRYGLSKEIGQYLGLIDTSVQAVYAFEPEYAAGALHLDSTGPGVDGGINLIVAVDRKNHALDSIVASLEDSMKEGVQSLLCAKANGSCYAMDVKIVDGEELASRRGYGALVTSLHAPPIRLWTRDDLA